MTPVKPLILLKKSGAFAFQLVSRPTTKSRHFGGEIDGSRGGKPTIIGMVAVFCVKLALAPGYPPSGRYSVNGAS